MNERDKDHGAEEDKRVFARIKDWARRKQKPEQKPEMVASMTVEDGLISFAAKILADGTYDLYTAPLKQEHQDFCTRCGKRTADLTVIHTCTPPRGLEMT